nr:alpha/beta fold hydrolase [Luteimonas aestuarii]
MCWPLLAILVVPPVFAEVDIDAYVRKEQFRDLKLSPDGRHLAATVQLEDRTGVAVLRLSDMSVASSFSLGRNTDIARFEWANNDRILLEVADKYGMLARPQRTGEIVSVSVSGRSSEMLVGQRVQSAGPGTRIQPRRPENVWAFLMDSLPTDEWHVIVTVGGFSEDAYTRAERMDVRSGRRTTLATVPVRRAEFIADHAGNVRFANGAGGDNVSKLYYRAAGSSEWSLINDEAETGRNERPLGFSADGLSAYFHTSFPRGTDGVVAFDVSSGERKMLVRDDAVDPYEVIYASSGAREPVGVLFMDGRPRKQFFDARHPEALLHQALDSAFEGELVRITSRSEDGRKALLLVTSDRNSGDFFLFDTVSRSAERVVSRREWLDPVRMAHASPVSFKARDGLDVHGYLTTPVGSSGSGMPLVVLPHGGPFGVQDTWEFDQETQLLAAAGYAVLRINFRGSSGYGMAFQRAGARQWGLAMQDDVTDATRWAIDQRIADPSRICIYGASYGAYASLMGVAKEPDLYQCAAGYVGVYDLATRRRALTSDAYSLRTFSDEWMGTDAAALRLVSPNHLAEQIKVPVFLSAGEEDLIAPPQHTRMMEAALKRAGVPVESMYARTEGHGFYAPRNLREYYGKLLAFLDVHIGAAATATGARND